MIMVQLTANTIVSASFFKRPSPRDVGGLFLHRFCTTTSIARTNAASVKSTVRFFGCEECQYVIPANALANDDRKVTLSLDNRCPLTLFTTGSRTLRPPRMMTVINLEGRGYTANHGESIEAHASLERAEETSKEFAFRAYRVFILGILD